MFFVIATSSPFVFFDRINGIKEFAEDVIKISNGDNLVVNDRMLFSSLSYELRNHPTKILMPHNPAKSITNHFQQGSGLNKDFDKSFFLIGDPKNISYLAKKHKTKLIRRFDKKFISEPIYLYEVTF